MTGDFHQNLAIQQQSAQLRSQIHHLNDTCRDIRISDSFSRSLSGREETCLSNCSDGHNPSYHKQICP